MREKLKKWIIEIRIWWFMWKLERAIKKHDRESLVTMSRCPRCYSLFLIDIDSEQKFCPVCRKIV